MIVDVRWIRAISEELRAFERRPLSAIEWQLDGLPVELPAGKAAWWEATGLGNVAFVELALDDSGRYKLDRPE